MAVDPVTGNLYLTSCTPCGQSPSIRYITGIYGPHPNPTINNFPNNTPDGRFDGLAWSCDGTRLVVASFGNDQIYQFDRYARTIQGFPLSVPGTEPDGVVFGAEGTSFAGYFFVNNENGTVSRIVNDGSRIETIASQGSGGDFVAVDTKGNLLLTQHDHVTLLSTVPGTPGTSGGQWVLPGSTQCSDLGCGAKAATIKQIDQDFPCLSGWDATLVLTLSQAACVDCAGCATLNQTRSTLLSLLNSLDPPRRCLDLLKATVTNMYLSCPCNCPCVPPDAPGCNPGITKLSGGTCLAETKFLLGFDLEWYDRILQPFMRRETNP